MASIYIKIVQTGSDGYSYGDYYNFNAVEFFDLDGVKIQPLDYTNILSHTWTTRITNQDLSKIFDPTDWYVPYSTSLPDRSETIINFEQNGISQINQYPYGNDGGQNYLDFYYSFDNSNWTHFGDVNIDSTFTTTQFPVTVTPVVTTFYLLKQNTDYFTINNNTIESLQIPNPTKQDFGNNGFQLSDLNNLDLNTLTDYELLMGTGSSDLELYSTGIYNNPIILKTENIINQNIQKINSIIFNYTKHENLDVKILTSFNNIDWLYYNTSTNEWEIQDINNITNQNTKQELEQKFNNLEYTEQFLIDLYFQFIIDQTNDLSHNFKLDSINLDLINDSQLKIIFSNEDNKWYGYDLDNNEQVLIDINHDIEIFNNGLDISQFNDMHNLNPNFWNDFQGGTNKLKFQYFLSINNTQEQIELDNLTMQVDINGTWKLQESYNQTSQTGDYSLELNDKTLRVNIFSDGSYKVNYNFIDETPPNDLISFELQNSNYGGNPQVKINWIPPMSYDYKDQVIMRKQDSYPNDIYDGQRINPILPQDSEFITYTENENEIIDQKNISQENTYYYRQFPFDIRYNYNENLNNNSKNIYIPTVPTDGMIAYYPLQNDYNGIENGISIIDRGQKFSDGWCNIFQNNWFDIELGSLSNFTISFNLEFTQAIPSQGMMIFSISGPYSYYPNIYANSVGELSWNTGDGNSNSFNQNPYAFQINNPYHITVINNDNTDVKLYINGVQFGIQNYRTLNDLPTLYFGRSGNQYNYTFTGKVNNFRIYNRQLTADEIQMIYNIDKMN